MASDDGGGHVPKMASDDGGGRVLKMAGNDGGGRVLKMDRRQSRQPEEVLGQQRGYCGCGCRKSVHSVERVRFASVRLRNPKR